MPDKKTRIAVISDIHANLIALTAFMEAIKNAEIDYIYHLGDAVYLGPYSSECLEILLNDRRVKMIMGNYEEYCIFGKNHPHRIYWNDFVIEHQNQANSFLSQNVKEKIKEFPYIIYKTFEKVTVTFLHYGMKENKDFVDIIQNPSATDLNGIFKNINSEIIFYGHNHSSSDVQGKARYINPGSLGCSEDEFARYIVFEVDKNGYTVEPCKIEYDKRLLFKAFEEMKIVGREQIAKYYFGQKN